MQRPRPAIIVLAVSCALLVGAPVAMIVTGSSSQEPAIEAIGDPEWALGSDDEAAATGIEPLAAQSLEQAWMSPVTADYYALEQPARPKRIRIPSLDVKTKVISVGLDKANAVDVPSDISKVGWYEYGVAPGSRQGSAVLVAHRDGSAQQGEGVFYDLGLLELGDKVVVVDADGNKMRYKVVAREVLDKSAFGKNAPTLFSLYGRHRLTLISCGGLYDPANGGYQANVIVTAVPAPGA